MTYIFRMICILMLLLLFQKVFSQHSGSSINDREPLDRFQQISKFIYQNKNSEVILTRTLSEIKKSGSEHDKAYYEFWINRVRKFDSKEIPTSETLQFFESYLPIAKKLNDHFFASSLYENLAQTYRMNNQFALALKSYLYAADEAAKDKRGIYFRNSYLFHQMGLQFYEFMDYEKALKFGLIASKTGYYNDPNPHEKWLAKANSNLIGESYRKLNKPDSALLWHRECLKISQGKLTSDSIWQGISLGSIAAVYSGLGEDNKALRYYLQSENILYTVGHYLPDCSVNMYSEIAEIFLKRKEPAQAAKYLIQAKEYLPGKEFNSSALHYYNSMIAYHKLTRNDQNGLLQSLDSGSVYQKLVEKELDIKQKINYEAEIAYEKQALQTLLAEEKYNKAQRTLYAILILSSLLGIIVILYLKRRNLRFRLQHQKIERQKEKAFLALSSAQKQLDGFARNIHDKNKLIEQFDREIKNLKLNEDEKADEKSLIIGKLKQSVILTEEDWQNYKVLFNKAYPRFSETIISQYPSVTAAELRYLMFNKLNLNNKEMSSLLGISLEAVRNLKFRVKKKTGITEAAKLVVD
jgi:DNA-binding CsgD family transcriptional regulator